MELRRLFALCVIAIIVSITGARAVAASLWKVADGPGIEEAGETIRFDDTRRFQRTVDAASVVAGLTS